MKNLKFALFLCLPVLFLCTQVDFNNPIDKNGTNKLDNNKNGIVDSQEDDDNDGIPNIYEDDDSDGTLNKFDKDSDLFDKDTNAPYFNIPGNDTLTYQLGDNFSERLNIIKNQVHATDKEDGDITNKIVFNTSDVSSMQVGVYPIYYTVEDNAQNSVKITRYISVVKVAAKDTTKPNINNPGNSDTVYLNAGEEMPKVTAWDDKDGDVEVKIKSGSVDTEKAGTYVIEYSATDAAGNTATKKITVIVTGIPTVDKIGPVITLKGDTSMTLSSFSDYKEPGCTAIDNHDGDITEKVTINYGNFKEGCADGKYQIRYNVTDSAKNSASRTRYICLNCDNVDGDPPVLTVEGGDTTYSVALRSSTRKVKAVDEIDGELPVTRNGKYDSTQTGTYTVIFSSIDLDNNQGVLTCHVTVVDPNKDTTKPVITLKGDAIDTVAISETGNYVDAGATAYDLIAGKKNTLTVKVTGEVDLATAGTYELTYTATDTSDNSSSVKRIVVVMSLDDKLLTKYSVPQATAFKAGDLDFESYSVEGIGVDDYKITGFTKLAFHWGGTNFYYFGFQFSSGSSPITETNTSNTLANKEPTFTIKGVTDANLKWLNATYYVTMSGENMVWVEKSGAFAITWKP